MESNSAITWSFNEVYISIEKITMVCVKRKRNYAEAFVLFNIRLKS